MNCPYCGWDLKITKEWVDSDGYHGIMVCNSMTGCEVTLNATTNLLWAYECGESSNSRAVSFGWLSWLKQKM